MLHALAQTTYTYTTTTSDDAAAGFLAGTFLLVLFLILLPLLIFYVVCLWKVFEKAGVEGWKAIIPVYNGWVLAEIAGKPGWWGIVGIAGVIPVLGWIASIVALVLYVIICIELSKKFGKDPVFSLVLIFLSVIGYAILAFGKAQYSKSAGGSAKPAAPAQA
jgi:cytochrome bd-type quinol oxidase subunit 2